MKQLSLLALYNHDEPKPKKVEGPVTANPNEKTVMVLFKEGIEMSHAFYPSEVECMFWARYYSTYGYGPIRLYSEESYWKRWHKGEFELGYYPVKHVQGTQHRWLEGPIYDQEGNVYNTIA